MSFISFSRKVQKGHLKFEQNISTNLIRSLRLTLPRWSHSLNANLFNRLGARCCGICLFPNPYDRAYEGTILYIYIYILLQNLIRKEQMEGLRNEKKNICSEKWKLKRLSSKYIKGYAAFLSFLRCHQMRTNRQTDAKSDKKKATLPYPWGSTSGAPFHTQRRQAAIEKGVSWSPLTEFDLFAFTFSFLLTSREQIQESCWFEIFDYITGLSTVGEVIYPTPPPSSMTYTSPGAQKQSITHTL